MQAAALDDLRRVLIGALRKALANKRPDDSLIDDVVQDSLLRVLDKLDQFAHKSKFTTWACSIAVRAALTELRRRRWKDVSLDQVAPDGEEVTFEAVDEGVGPDEAAQRGALVTRLGELIRDTLTDRQRTALQAELAGMPQEEIARRIGSTRNAIYKLMHDARKKLKAGLVESGYSEQDVAEAFA